MITIKCSACKSKIFKYRKIGKGRILRCYKKRIMRDYSKHENDKIKCKKCGKVIGIDRGSLIRMKQSAFITSGFKE